MNRTDNRSCIICIHTIHGDNVHLSALAAGMPRKHDPPICTGARVVGGANQAAGRFDAQGRANAASSWMNRSCSIVKAFTMCFPAHGPPGHRSALKNDPVIFLGGHKNSWRIFAHPKGASGYIHGCIWCKS